MDPSELRYTKTHEWVMLDGEAATVGISDFAVKLLTDLVYIELPQVGAEVKQGESCGEVESVKAVSDLYSPLSGEVTDVNSALADDLGALSDDPFGSGWIFKLKPADASEADSLLDRKAYETHCESEEH